MMNINIKEISNILEQTMKHYGWQNDRANY